MGRNITPVQSGVISRLQATTTLTPAAGAGFNDVKIDDRYDVFRLVTARK